MGQTMHYYFRCPECKTKNNIPADKVGLVGKCGKCKSDLQTRELKINTPVIVDDLNFGLKVLQAPLPVLVDCWAPWCGPCKMMTPIMNELAFEWQGKIRVCKLNTEQNQVIPAKFKIMSIPTLLIFDRGQMIDSIVGAVPKNQIIAQMRRHFSV